MFKIIFSLYQSSQVATKSLENGKILLELHKKVYPHLEGQKKDCSCCCEPKSIVLRCLLINNKPFTHMTIIIRKKHRNKMHAWSTLPDSVWTTQTSEFETKATNWDMLGQIWQLSLAPPQSVSNCTGCKLAVWLPLSRHWNIEPAAGNIKRPES